jgi:hypothetical protein
LRPVQKGANRGDFEEESAACLYNSILKNRAPKRPISLWAASIPPYHFSQMNAYPNPDLGIFICGYRCLSAVIPIPNENHTFAGTSFATPGLITVLQQRASQAKPLHGSTSEVSCSLGKGIKTLSCFGCGSAASGNPWSTFSFRPFKMADFDS